MQIRTAYAAARLPRSRRDATTLEINTLSIDKTLVMRPNICKCIRYIDLNDKTLLENTLGTLKKRNTPRRWCATRSEVALRVWRPAACLQAAQLAPKIYYNRPRSGPTEGQRQYGNGLFYSNATFETLFSLFGGQFTDEVTFIKLFFSDYVVVYSSSDWSRALICNGIN